ncbi:hypothetical protein [Hoyosella altamirensis]|uniref:Uncharacterized protein n=1 Tax=Hoyosella altamirensis TaxID=616997 RepID=A0A839RUT5_9ACTN|nr:hypothetical protein [Hoyosella altamirensis]MBB3040109.1 hypothetical protein [Hoyosella altamirensis]
MDHTRTYVLFTDSRGAEVWYTPKQWQPAFDRATAFIGKMMLSGDTITARGDDESGQYTVDYGGGEHYSAHWQTHDDIRVCAHGHPHITTQQRCQHCTIEALLDDHPAD